MVENTNLIYNVYFPLIFDFIEKNKNYIINEVLASGNHGRTHYITVVYLSLYCNHYSILPIFQD